ncbi:MAG: DUF2520 domain-containing protein [Desulfuromonas sp.]|nr:MAG: DUF2520 domain-containing protein [Desulfuromonas sp.]
MKPAIALIGPGRVGCAVTRRLHLAGYPVMAVIARERKRAVDACSFIGCPTGAATEDLTTANKAEIILLAVPDDAIASVTEQLQNGRGLPESATLIHFSGLHNAACMRRPKPTPQLLSLHPLLPFADRESATNRLPGCPCTLEGDTTALPLGRELIRAIGGTPFVITGDKKALYHGAASIASNFFITLEDWASQLLSECGISRKEALPLLLPLVRASLDNLTEHGPEQGLTGPIVRGDVGTVARHLDELEQLSPQQQETYRQLATMTLELASRSGRLDASAAERLTNLLNKK